MKALLKFTQTVITNGEGGNLGFQLSAWSLDHQVFIERLRTRTWEAPYVTWQQYMTGINVPPPSSIRRCRPGVRMGLHITLCRAGRGPGRRVIFCPCQPLDNHRRMAPALVSP
jgi:hypothetical protein